MSSTALTGLDGSNPLAFLAALGVLTALHERGHAPRLSWRLEGVWVPVVHCNARPTMASIIDELVDDQQDAQNDPALAFTYQKKGKPVPDVKPPPEVLHQALQGWVDTSSPDQRRTLDWFTAFVSEGALDNNDAAKPSALHFTAGQQKFLKAAQELAHGTTMADIEAALVGPWAYDRKLPVMGWDNTQARDYALRATNPSNDKKLGNPGADWLALRGLALLPTAASRQRQQTPCVMGGWKTGRLTWPIWNIALTLPAARGLLFTRDLHEMSAHDRSRRGVAQVFQSRILRSDQGGYGSVTPAQVL